MRFTIGIYSIFYLAGIFHLIPAQMTKPLHLCCRNESLLVTLSDDILNTSIQYKCMPADLKLAPGRGTHNSSMTIISNTHNDIYGYGITSQKNPSLHSNIPNCDHQTIMQLKDNSYLQIPSRSCLIGLDNSLAVISCPLRNKDHMLHLNVMNKCCPPSFIYDGKLNQCIEKTKELNSYDQLLSGHILFRHSKVVCPGNKVIVEYEIDNSWISFESGHLNLNKWQGQGQGKGKQLPNYYDYCLEAIYLIVQQSDITGGQYIQATNTSLLRICTDVEICQQLPCIRRCCHDDSVLVKDNITTSCRAIESQAYFSRISSMQIEANFSKPNVFGLLHGLDCKKFRLDPIAFDDEFHSISHKDGSLQIAATKAIYSNERYCIERMLKKTGFSTFVCFDDQIVLKDRWRFRIYGIGLLISCSFYAITLLVYLMIPKLRNLPGKILICLVSSLLVAYLGIALGQLMPTDNDNICFVSGFFIYFCLMAAFAWMNVTSFDIWQIFGASQRKQVFHSRQKKRFLLYSAYGWGLPCLITCITVGLTKSNVLPDSMRPHFGRGRCWFTYDSSGLASLLFFSGPVSILFLINFVLCVLTLRYCNRVKREIFRMQSLNIEKPGLRKSFFMDKSRFAMNTKLFVAMGITWLLELLSIILYNAQMHFIWVISDSFNVLLGISVFFIFVFKKRNWQLILERFGKSHADAFKTTTTAISATSSIRTQSNLNLNNLETHQGNIGLLTHK